MQNITRIIQLGYERALFRFSALAHRTVQDANTNLSLSLSKQGGNDSYRTRQDAHEFLLKNGDRFLVQLEVFFRDHLERAMRTMYQDLRRDIGNVSADNLSLIDDETINRNIDVDRLVQRMRDADQQSLGRLNMIIAQLHDDHEVRERENPFRPYLLARSLYEVLWAMQPEEKVAGVLFEYLSTSMVHQLPDYFAAIREVFESSGVHAHLVARASTLSKAQRLEMAQKATAQRLAAIEQNLGGGGNPGSSTTHSINLPNSVSQDVLTSLQRVLATIPRHQAGAQSGEHDQENRVAAFQDFVSDMFAHNRKHRSSFEPEVQDSGFPRLAEFKTGDQPFEVPAQPLAASPMLVAKLNEYQEIAARGESINEGVAAEGNQLFALRENLDPEKTTTLERVTIDVVASLFEFILVDEQIPASLRVHIGRLQIPFLKAAMLTPDLLRQDSHPARQLLNRMGSVGLGIDPDGAMGRALADEIARIVVKILNEFNEEMGIFSICLDELDRFVAQQLRHVDSETAASIDNIEEEEETGVLLIKTTIALRNLMAPLQTDQRIADFIVEVWVRVLVRAFWQTDSNPLLAATASTTKQAYCDVFADLMWSAQGKDPGERGTLLKLLPDLINRLKAGLALIQLSNDEIKHAMDQLFDVHAEVLRGGVAPSRNPMSLDEMRQHFSPLAYQLGTASTDEIEHTGPQIEAIDNTAAEPGTAATLEFEPHIADPETDTEWLHPMQVGTSVERWSGHEYKVGRLVWTSMRRTLFMLKMEKDPKPVVYSATALTKALREGSVRLVEHAPVFDRAVESLLIGAESIPPHLA